MLRSPRASETGKGGVVEALRPFSPNGFRSGETDRVDNGSGTVGEGPRRAYLSLSLSNVDLPRSPLLSRVVTTVYHLTIPTLTSSSHPGLLDPVWMSNKELTPFSGPDPKVAPFPRSPEGPEGVVLRP